MRIPESLSRPRWGARLAGLVGIALLVVGAVISVSYAGQQTSQLEQASAKMMVLRSKPTHADRLPEDYRRTKFDGHQLTHSRRVGRVVRRRALYIGFVPGKICVVQLLVTRDQKSSSLASSCNTTAHSLNSSAWSEDEQTMSGLAPDGVRCVSVRRTGAPPVEVPTRQNAWIAATNAKQRAHPIHRVVFRKGECRA